MAVAITAGALGATVAAGSCLATAQESSRRQLCATPCASGVVRGGSRAGSLREGRAALGLSLSASCHRRFQQRRPTVTCGLFGLGVPELAVIAGVAAVLFGPKQLPEIGKGLGKTVRSFQQAAKDFESELKAGAETAAEKVEERVEKVENAVSSVTEEKKK